MTLNPRQRKAVEYTAGPLEVVAGPGTGKTRVITEKVVHLTTVEKMAPDEILALTFTEKAAAEMAGRIRTALSKAGVKGQPEVGTIHAFCLRLVQEYADRVGFDAEPKLLVGPLYVQFIAENVDKLVTDHTDLVGKVNTFANNLAKFVSLCHDERLIGTRLVEDVDAWIEGLGPKEKPGALKARDLAASIPVLLDIQRRQNVVTYGDLITLAVRLLEENEDVRDAIQTRHAYLLVDEYQDNNRAQSDLVRLLAGSHRRVCVVGDEDQSIYRFRGARAGIMQRFLDEWRTPTQAVELVTLEENYRSTAPIIDAGQALIRHNPGRTKDKLVRRADLSEAEGPADVSITVADTEATERAFILQEIRRHVGEGRAAGDIAILTRSLAHATLLVAHLRDAGIGVEVVGGGGLFNDPAVREVLAWLKGLDDAEGNEVAIHRLLRLQSYGLTHEDQRVLGRAARDAKVPLMTLLKRLEDPGARLAHVSEQGHQRIRGYLKVQERFHTDARPQGRPDVAGLVLDILDLTSIGRRLTPDDVEDRQSLAALGGLLQAAQNYQEHFPYPSLHGFVRHLDLLEELGHDDTIGDASRDAATVKVMTVHQSKGREFPVVIIPHLHRFPPDNKREWPRKFLDHATLEGADVAQIHEEEERRVLYVAMTRAMGELLLTTSELAADGKAIGPSPYLEEIRGSPRVATKRVTAGDIEPAAALAGAHRTRRAQEARLVYLVSRLGAHAEGRDVEDALKEAIGLVGGLLADGAEGGVVAVERALKHIGLSVPPEVRYLEPDKPKGLQGPLYLSASSLNVYSECPRQFYYKQVVRIPETAGFEARLGTAIHKALEDFHRKHKVPSMALFDELAALFDTNVGEVEFKSVKEREQGLARGRRILALYLEEEAARGTRVVDVEKGFSVTMRVGARHVTGRASLAQGEDADGDDVVITGKIDRVDVLQNGKVRVVDYKTGRVKSRSEYLGDFQMPIYAWAVTEELGLALESVEVIGLKEIKDLKSGPALERQLLPYEGGSRYAITAERIAQLKKDIERIVVAMREGKFDASPEERRCGWCKYNLLCGAAWGTRGEDKEAPRTAA